MDVLGNIEFETLILFAIVITLAIVVVFINGVSLRIGSTKIDIGGIRKLIERRDNDITVSMGLQKQCDELDRDTYATIADITDSIDEKLLLVHKGSCYFPSNYFYDLVRKELYRRTNRNNLKSKLTVSRRETYVSEIKKAVRDRYRYFAEIIDNLGCGETYPSWDMIRASVHEVIDDWIVRVVEVLVTNSRLKLQLYKDSESRFTTDELRERYCVNKIQNNRRYIKELGYEVEGI